MAFGPQDGELFLRLRRENELRQLLTYVLDDQVPLVVFPGKSKDQLFDLQQIPSPCSDAMPNPSSAIERRAICGIQAASKFGVISAM